MSKAGEPQADRRTPAGEASSVGESLERTAEWAYRGVWSVLTNLFHVPQHPPTLPALAGETVESFRPSRSWLNYMRLEYWITTAVMALSCLFTLVVVFVAAPIVGAILLVPGVLLVGVPAVLRYLAMHLRYDTTWYVFNSRSLRIRRGIWVLHETTITFENVQDVSVTQGPLERWFGFATVVVKTAGGGGGHGPHGIDLGSHIGFLEGLSNASEVRDMILQQLKLSKHAGLGDEAHSHDVHSDGGFSAELTSNDAVAGVGEKLRGVVRRVGVGPAGLATLREIRDAVQRLRTAAERTT